jgi:cell division septum initiation protein DivIVA
MLDEFIKARSRAVRDFSTDDILSALGLQRQTTTIDAAIPTALAFVAGVAAGAGVALLLAPKSGREVRQDISNKATELTSKLQATANELTSKLQSTATELTSEVRNALPIGGESPRNADATPRTLGTSTNRTS